MSKLETIEAEVRKLPLVDAVELQDWLAVYLEDSAELKPEFVESIKRGNADLQEGNARVYRPGKRKNVSQATELYSREFDAIFFDLPAAVRSRIMADIRDLGRRLDSFPHWRLQGRPEYRLRVGDYRVIYQFDVW